MAQEHPIYSWTQSICVDCWNEKNPTRQTIHTNTNSHAEMCAYCGQDTYEGIFVRDNPTNCKYPAIKD